MPKTCLDSLDLGQFFGFCCLKLNLAGLGGAPDTIEDLELGITGFNKNFDDGIAAKGSSDIIEWPAFISSIRVRKEEYPVFVTGRG